MNIDSIISNLNEVRLQNPLVHNITNYVVMNNTANALLAIGASPVMAHAIEEMEEIVNISSSLVINIGTLSEKWIEAMLIAGISANKKGIPIILDPVGVGASAFRTKTAVNIIETCQPSIVRGNASEIMALANSSVITKGVDSSENSSNALEHAKLLAEKYNSIIVISGAVDYVTDGKSVFKINNGSPMMSKVTGMGCTATAIIGAFAAVNANNYLTASISAMAVMSIAGEITAEQSDGPGSFQSKFLDVLYTISENDILSRIKLSENE